MLDCKSTSSATIHARELHSGSVRVSGYKHATTVIMAASLINPEQHCQLLNTPSINDMKYMSFILNALGGQCCVGEAEISIETSQLRSHQVPERFSQHIHGAIYFLPTLLGRLQQVELGNCGGCQIGNTTVLGHRPIDHMLKVLKKFGARFETKNNKIVGHCTGYKACTIDIMDYSDEEQVLTGPLVSGATKTAILAAASVKHGVTTILNPYPKPDVTELLHFLTVAGYDITQQDQRLTISRKPNLPKHCTYTLMSDISQIMTYITVSVFHAIALNITQVSVERVKKGLAPEFSFLAEMGVQLQFGDDTLYIQPPAQIHPIDIRVLSIGIYSDHQPFFALMLTHASSSSTITECVWKKRFDYAHELKKLGLKLSLTENCLTVQPSTVTTSEHTLIARDLRAAATLLIAALAAPGTTTIEGLSHLARGYEYLIEDLRALGADIVLAPPPYLLDPLVYQISPYIRDYPANVIDLKRCVLNHPALDALLHSIGQLDMSALKHYPDIELAKQTLSTALAIDQERLLLSAGSDCMIFYLLNALTRLNHQLVLQAPNYFAWENYALLNNAPIIKIPYRARLAHSLPSTPSLVVISNPNNPTGHCIAPEELIEIADRCALDGHLLIIDECFSGFSQIDHYQLLGDRDHVIFVRSFSKCFGLAGARIALTIAPKPIVDYLSRWRPDSSVSYPAIWFLSQLLQKQTALKQIHAQIVTTRTQFISDIRRIKPNWHALPSAANFVTFQLLEDSAQAVVQGLKQRGFLIKDLSSCLGSDHIRIGIADDNIMRDLVLAITQMNEVLV